ncbi:MAG: glutamate-5-semialdehyde dehydrogenase [Candidatus Methanomethyliaceae archaeon]|nr:glutamate-5-semialdehyde dehydrogenase [Candidatus Methanomethyliaceae archaeon]MDW7970430.1 glutamate-5-semialdehyde dehydrogenase [Nitrososphaerota archaeon]
MSDVTISLYEQVMFAKKASLILANLPRNIKDEALRAAALAIKKNKDLILEANKLDMEIGHKLLKEGKLIKPLLDRLKLDESKINEICKMIEKVAELDDPVGKTVYSMEMDKGLRVFKITVPFGVIAAIFESRPDALPQIASLCIKSGNAVLLKGGSEAKESNRALFKVIYEAFIAEGLPKGCMQLLEEREAIKEILKMEDLIDLIIPRGSNEFVKYIQENTRIPVLGHSAGICHIYVDGSAKKDIAVEICHDARVQYPAACNSMKILLIDRAIAKDFLPDVAKRLIESGVKIKGCSETLEILKHYNIPAEPAIEEDWSTEYLDLTLPIKIVNGVDEAIEHINRYGSHHTDSIIAEDISTVKKFLSMVDSSTVMHNASTRFSDGYRYGLGAEVGISTNKIHARGPVGLEGLVTTKYILLGSGQKVADYVGKNAKPFIHRRIEGSWLDYLGE